jgi:hypothetical protein
MLVASIAVWVLVVAGYAANRIDFLSEPFSLLIDGRRWWFYHLILCALVAALAIYARHVATQRRLLDLAAVAATALIFLTLNGVTASSGATHDILAGVAMAIASGYSIAVAARHADALMGLLALAGFVVFTFLFTGDLAVQAKVEATLLTICLVELNVDYYGWFNRIPLPARWSGWMRLVEGRGRMGAAYWSISNLLILGLCGVISHNFLGGPLVAVAAACGGWLAWRDDAALLIRLAVLMGAVATPLAILGVSEQLVLTVATLLPAAMLGAFNLFAVVVYDIYGDDLR